MSPRVGRWGVAAKIGATVSALALLGLAATATIVGLYFAQDAVEAQAIDWHREYGHGDHPNLEKGKDRAPDDAAEIGSALVTVQVAYFQLAVGLLGTAGLAATVYFAGRAWWASELSVRASRDALDHAREATARQLRPYVFLTSRDEIREIDVERGVSIACKNFGQTPAIDVRVWRSSQVVMRPIGDALPPLPEQWEDVFPLGPGASIELHALFGEVPQEWFDEIKAGRAALLVRTRVEYEFAPGQRDGHEVTIVVTDEALREGRLLLASNLERKKG